MKKYLVTGATGFVGSNLARRLVTDGHVVLGTGTAGEQPLPEGVINLGRDYADITEGVDAVFHQAADNDPQSKDLVGIHKVNVHDTVVLFENLYKMGCRKFIYASSTAVYGNSPAPYYEDQTPIRPLTPYAYSKAAMEQCVHAFQRLHPDACCLGMRYCNVYGPGEHHKGHRASMIHQLIKTMLAGKAPRLFKHGHQMRDWVHVNDVVQANVKAASASTFQDAVVNIGSGGCTSFLVLVGNINAALGTRIEPEWIDNPFEGTYQDHTQCDITLARTLLGFEPEFGSYSGLRHYIENWS